MNDPKSPRIFVASFSTTGMSAEEIAKFYVFVKNNRLVDDWHSPYTGSLFIRSAAEPEDLANSLHEFQDKSASLLVTELAPKANAGFLPPESWKWIEGHGIEITDI